MAWPRLGPGTGPAGSRAVHMSWPQQAPRSDTCWPHMPSPSHWDARLANFPLIIAPVLLSLLVSAHVFAWDPVSCPGSHSRWICSGVSFWGMVPARVPSDCALGSPQAEPSGAGPLGLSYALAGLDHGLGGHRLRLLLPRAVRQLWGLQWQGGPRRDRRPQVTPEVGGQGSAWRPSGRPPGL